MSSKGSTKAGKAKAMCPFGKTPYPTKRDAEKAGVAKPKRCGRCRDWH